MVGPSVSVIRRFHCISKVANHHYACVCTYTHAICFNSPVKDTKSTPKKNGYDCGVLVCMVRIITLTLTKEVGIYFVYI